VGAKARFAHERRDRMRSLTPSLKSEISTPRTKTCPWGPDLGTQRFACGCGAIIIGLKRAHPGDFPELAEGRAASRRDPMPTDVIMPQMGESIFEALLPSGSRRPAQGREGRAAVEISTDKVDAEIPAPVLGCSPRSGLQRVQPSR